MTFLILVLGQILCLNTGAVIQACYLALTTAHATAKYDWCSFAFSYLVEKIKVFKSKCEACGECKFFLVVSSIHLEHKEDHCTCLRIYDFFLQIIDFDRLNRPPVEWGVFQRVKVWTKELVKKVMEAGKKPNKDYGKSSVICFCLHFVLCSYPCFMFLFLF